MPDPAPLLVAHRAGNTLETLRAAESAAVDLVEADVWLGGGAGEVRHAKTMGPVPLLWDRWLLAPGWTPRLLLADVLHAARASTEFMFDLKGHRAALPGLVAETMRRVAPGRPYTVSSQSWELLDHFGAMDHVRVVYSIGSGRMLRALPSRLGGRHPDAVGIHQRMLDAARVADLRALAPAVFSWPVNDRTRFDELVGWGVTGLISDRWVSIGQSGERAPAP